jgi:putative ABC transport system ATP-binding protein
MSLLKLNNLTYKYPGTSKPVLNEITADFDTGRIYAIIGKSGAGKTTLLSLISGLDIPTGGEILYKNKNLTSIDRDDYRAKDIGVIFQSYNLLTNATAAENIVLSMNISAVPVKDKKTYAYSIADKVGIDKETADRKILKLSGGEQQRVGIARALSHNPDLIIADEPTGNLDDATAENIMSILTNLAHNENKCVLIVTHSKKIAAYADTIFQISDNNLKLV